ncbi:hypothetical protein [Vandammella animalimorsus]|uniref:hypothetical protein n=1 Tax=Vandammella animalimorsus TaxID=2029117 RepID=UPI0015C6AFAB|nr:hypothetical protein [Vandammella animalimorsus]
MVKALLAHAQAEGAVPEKKKGFAAGGSGAQIAVAQRVSPVCLGPLSINSSMK